MPGLFNENNFLNIALLKLWNIILSNLLFILCCIPIVTIGPSFTALYHCTLRITKGNLTDGVLKTFFRAFKSNFKQSIAVWIISALLLALLYSEVLFLKDMDTTFSRIWMYMVIILMIFVAVINLYIYPVIAAFEGKIKDLLKNSFYFAGKHLLKTLLMALIWIFPCFITFWDTQLQPLYVFCWFFFLFSTLALLNSKLLYKMFKPYLNEEETEVPEECYDDGQAYLS